MTKAGARFTVSARLLMKLRSTQSPFRIPALVGVMFHCGLEIVHAESALE